MRPAITIPTGGPRRGQRGLALLALTALIMVVSVGILLERLTKAANNTTDEVVETMAALARGKAALLAYAAADPNRPGEMPCPDANNDRQSLPGDDYTGSPCTYRLGWLPTTTLDIERLEDGTGAPLWYAVAQDYAASGTGVLNSETDGAIDVSGQGDVVAVVIAPGTPFDAQSARPALGTGLGASTDVSQFLEAENANTNLDQFVTAAAGDFNDRIITITRAEVMQLVERRVLGQVERALERYQDPDLDGTANFTAFPWLTALGGTTKLSSRLDGEFRATTGTRAGHLSFYNDDGLAASFTTNFTLTWDVENTSFFPISNYAYVNDTMANGWADPTDGSASYSSVSCTWSGGDSPSCTTGLSGRVVATGSALCTGGLAGTPIPVDREYWFQFSPEAGTALTESFSAPTAGNFRRRSISVSYPSGTPFPSSGPSIFVVRFRDFDPITGNQCGVGLSATTLTSYGDISITGMRHELTVPEELPEWFVDNDWHHLVGAAFSSGLAPGGGGTCTAGTDCLTVNGVTPADDKSAVLMIAGEEVNEGSLTQDREDQYAWDRYFEDENNNVANDTFQITGTVAGEFNDKMRTYTP